MTTTVEFTKRSLAFGCVCLERTCKEKPTSFINHQQMIKHQQSHANVPCPECNKCFGAKRNMKRHVKNVHKARDTETSTNSNKSNTDENFNDDPIDLDNVEFDIARD